VESRLHPVRLDGGDIPSTAGVERGPQLLLGDGVRPGVGTFVAEAQHVQRSIRRGDRREARHVRRSLVVVQGVEQAAVQHRLEPAPQPVEVKRVRRDELHLELALVGRLPGDGECRLRDVDTENRQPQRSDVKRVLPGSAAGIEHRSGESALSRQADDCRLGTANIPGCGTVVVRRVPGLSRHPFVTGWLPTAERIVSEAS